MSKSVDNAEKILDYLMQIPDITNISGDVLSTNLNLAPKDVNEALKYLKSIGAIEVIKETDKNSPYDFKVINLLLFRRF
jgi:hypothetical protein